MRQILKGVQDKPVRVVWWGTPNIGKTTVVAQAPKPIMICAERGADLIDVDKVEVHTWAELIEEIDRFAKDRQGYESLIIDTLDAAERFAIDETLRRCKCDTPSDKSLGFGVWRQALGQTWRLFSAALDRAWVAGLNIVMTAHEQLKHIDDPIIGGHDKLMPKMDRETWGPIREWVDDCIYLSFEHGIQKSGQGTLAKSYAVATGKRIAYTNPSGGFDAKNRHNLPATFPFEKDTSWPLYWSHVMAARRTPDAVKTSILKLLEANPKKDADLVKRVLAAVEKAAGDRSQLVNIERHLKEA